MSTDNKIKILKTIIQPKIMYGLTIWTRGLPSNINDLQRLLNSYTRCCASAKWYMRNNQVQRGTKMKTLKEDLEVELTKTKDKITKHQNLTSNNIAI